MLLSPFARVPFAERLATYMTLLRSNFTDLNPAEKYARTQRIMFSMTWHDISCGVRMVCSECPIALMLKRYIKAEYQVFVGPTVISFGISVMHSDNPDHAFSYRIATPEYARAFISDFDLGRRPTPIQFPLDIPEAMLKPAFLNSHNTTNPKTDHEHHTAS